jgi:hypothetical protein
MLNRPLTLVGVLAYSALVGALRWYGVIGDRGAFILFGIMVLDLLATHWLLARLRRKTDPPKHDS